MLAAAVEIWPALARCSIIPRDSCEDCRDSDSATFAIWSLAATCSPTARAVADASRRMDSTDWEISIALLACTVVAFRTCDARLDVLCAAWITARGARAGKEVWFHGFPSFQDWLKARDGDF